LDVIFTVINKSNIIIMMKQTPSPNSNKKTWILQKIKFFLLASPAILLLTVFTPNFSDACPYCNLAFYKELVGSRQGSLLSEELLSAMEKQGKTGGETIFPPSSKTDNPQEKKDFIEIINRDNNLSIPPTSYVKQDVVPDKKVSIELYEGEVYLGQGVIFKGFVTNGTIPGPTIIVNEGDIIEFSVINKGTIAHGASIHAAYTQTSKYLGKIGPGETKKMLFKVTYPGVYMYHCAPGGHAIPMHIIFGQYGMMVVKPKKQYKLEQILKKKPDVEIYLTQHEFYSNGKDAIEGHPIYTTFNGKIFRYVEEPIKAKPGDYVRIYFLNAGPNLVSTFHIVGIIWDFAYWQGNPDVVFPGGQSVIAGPTDSWVVEFRMPPDEGAFLMLSHAVGSTDRGAIGILACDANAQTPLTVLSDGPNYTPDKFAEIKSKATRIISPFEPGSSDVDVPAVYGGEVKEVTIKIIGNSFYPKVVHVAEGTKIRWINEDVFSYMDGEFAGIHNAATYEAPDNFNSPMLAHTESFVFQCNKEGTYKYLCTPHPYMKKEIIVGDVSGSGSNVATSRMTLWFFIIIGAILIAIMFLLVYDRRRKPAAAN